MEKEIEKSQKVWVVDYLSITDGATDHFIDVAGSYEKAKELYDRVVKDAKNEFDFDTAKEYDDSEYAGYNDDDLLYFEEDNTFKVFIKETPFLNSVTVTLNERIVQ